MYVLLESELNQADRSGLGIEVLMALVADAGFVPYDGPAEDFESWLQGLREFVADDGKIIEPETHCHGAYVSVGSV